MNCTEEEEEDAERNSLNIFSYFLTIIVTHFVAITSLTFMFWLFPLFYFAHAQMYSIQPSDSKNPSSISLLILLVFFW